MGTGSLAGQSSITQSEAKSYGTHVQLNDPDTVRLQRELNISTLRTASKLFERLELQPTEDQPEEAGRVVARLFIRYSSFLWKMLTTLDLSVCHTTCGREHYSDILSLPCRTMGSPRPQASRR